MEITILFGLWLLLNLTPTSASCDVIIVDKWLVEERKKMKWSVQNKNKLFCLNSVCAHHRFPQNEELRSVMVQRYIKIYNYGVRLKLVRAFIMQKHIYQVFNDIPIRVYSFLVHLAKYVAKCRSLD